MFPRLIVQVLGVVLVTSGERELGFEGADFGFEGSDDEFEIDLFVERDGVFDE